MVFRLEVRVSPELIIVANWLLKTTRSCAVIRTKRSYNSKERSEGTAGFSSSTEAIKYPWPLNFSITLRILGASMTPFTILPSLSLTLYVKLGIFLFRFRFSVPVFHQAVLLHLIE